MKTILLLSLAAGLAVPAQAQLFSREALGGAAIGGILGGVIGHNSGRKTAEGIGIGAGAGLLLGALSNDYQRQAGYPRSYAPEPMVFGGNNHRYATTGTVLGGIAGGVIGHNNGRRTAEGVAIGAASGLVFGAVADHSLHHRGQYYPAYQTPAVRHYQPVVTYPQYRHPQHHHHYPVVPTVMARPVVVSTPIVSGHCAPVVHAAPAPAQTIIINNYYSAPATSMGYANSMFGR